MISVLESCFSQCYKLESIDFGLVKEIPYAVCEYCCALEQVKAVKAELIQTKAFYECVKLKTIPI